VGVRGVPAAMRALRAIRGDGGGDRAAAVLARAVRGLPAERAEWGSAMCAELAGVSGGRARWVFSLGCARAAIVLRLRASIAVPGRGDRGVRALLLVALAATGALAAYGPVHYPALRSGTGTWAAATALVLLALGYAAGALALSRGPTARAVAARRHGLAGGLCVGLAWLMVVAPVAPAAIEKRLVFVPLAVALLAPAVVAALAGRSSGDARAATAASLWSGLLGGVLVFIIWVTMTYIRDGRPYDAQLLRDFRASGSRDLAAYAVSDNLGAALGMLLIVPVVALALGSLTGRVMAARAR
jgi:hypothetical protein